MIMTSCLNYDILCFLMFRILGAGWEGGGLGKGGEQGKHKATAGLHQRERERETTTTKLSVFWVN